MRILLTGASGFIGSHAGQFLAREHQVLGVTHENRRRLPFDATAVDLRERALVDALLDRFRPDIIVHTAALSRVLACERQPELAHAINVTATSHLIRWASARRVRLIFFSSDQVFSGRRGGYRESDVTTPVNAYGRYKLAAERETLDAASRNLVIRSNSVVGSSIGWGESFSEWVAAALRSGEEVRLFRDQYRSPIHVDTMTRIVEAACLNQEANGVLHAGGPERLSRLDTGFAVARAYGLSPDSIVDTSYQTHPQAGIMPADSSFDIARLRQMMPAVEILPIDEALAKDARNSATAL